MTKVILQGISIMALALSGGCAMLPQQLAPYEPPAASTLLPRAELIHQSAPGLQSIPEQQAFWQLFGDELLGRTVAAVSSDNLDLAMAQARLRQAAASAKSARAASLPAGNVSGSVGSQVASRNGTQSGILSLPGADRANDVFELGTAASWEVDLFGGRAAATRSAQAGADASAAAVAAIRTSIAAETASTYIDLRVQQQRKALLENQIALLWEITQLSELRVRQGRAAEIELRQTNAQLAGAQAELPKIQTAIELNLNRLDVLQGNQPGTSRLGLMGIGPVPKTPELRLDITAQDLLRRRPDIVAAERQLASAYGVREAMIAEYYPKFTLGALLGLQSLEPGKLLESSAMQASGLFGVRWRLFDFGRLEAERAKSDASADEALARYRQAALASTEDIENALVLSSNLTEQDRSIQQLLVTKQRLATIAEGAWRAGASSKLAVLQAQVEVLQVQDGSVALAGARARAAVSQFRAIGGGWSKAELDTSRSR